MLMITQFSYKDSRTSVWGNVFHVKISDVENQNLRLQEEEIEDIILMSKDVILQRVQMEKEEGYDGPLMTPDSVAAFKKLLKALN